MKHCLPKGVGALRHRWQRVHWGRRARRLSQRICLLCPSWPGGGLSVLFVNFSYFLFYISLLCIFVCLFAFSLHPSTNGSPLCLLCLSWFFQSASVWGRKLEMKKNGSRDDKRRLLYQNIPFLLSLYWRKNLKSYLSSGARRISWGITRTEGVFSWGEKQLFLGNKFLVFGASMIYWYAMRCDDLLYNGCASTLQTYVDNNDNNNNQDNDNIDVHYRHTWITMITITIKIMIT